MNREIDPDFGTASALGSDSVMFDNFPATYEVIGKVTPIEQPEVVQVKAVEKKVVFDPTKKYEYKTPSVNDQLKAFKQIFFDLNFARYVTMNEQSVLELLHRIDSYVNYHSTSHAEVSEEEHQQNINAGFWKFIINDETKGLREVLEKPEKVQKPAKKQAKKVTKAPRKKRVVQNSKTDL